MSKIKLDLINKIKRLTIIALASDDELMESLVLKGGNAIDLAYHDHDASISRTSYDLDYSLVGGDFSEDIRIISSRIKDTLSQTFLEEEFVLLDFKFEPKPKHSNSQIADFWGGYKATFKVIDQKTYSELEGNLPKIQRSALSLNLNNSTVFELEFSKYEYVEPKTSFDVDGYKIYIYTPEMIVFEKLRAICQQLPAYQKIVPFSPRPRARDFYDIYIIMNNFNIDPLISDHEHLLKNIFRAKKVPLEFISQIRQYKEIHKDNWLDVINTVSAKSDLQEFDFYFNFVLDEFEAIIPLLNNKASN